MLYTWLLCFVIGINAGHHSAVMYSYPFLQPFLFGLLTFLTISYFCLHSFSKTFILLSGITAGCWGALHAEEEWNADPGNQTRGGLQAQILGGDLGGAVHTGSLWVKLENGIVLKAKSNHFLASGQFTNVFTSSRNLLFTRSEVRMKDTLQPQQIPNFIQKMPISTKLKSWYACMLTGNLNLLSSSTTESMKQLGILHLFILSGWHLGFLILAIHCICKTPFIILHMTRRLRPHHTPLSVFYSDLLSIIVTAYSCIQIGMAPPIQRVLIVFTAHLLSKHLLGPRPTMVKFLEALMIQTILFPSTWHLESNLMSWCSVLWINLYFVVQKTYLQRLAKPIQYVIFQFGFCLLLALIYGHWNINSFWSCALFIPLIGLIYSSALGDMLSCLTLQKPIPLLQQSIYLMEEWVLRLAEYVKDFKWTSFSNNISISLRLLYFLIILLFLLNPSWFKSKRGYQSMEAEQ